MYCVRFPCHLYHLANLYLCQWQFSVHKHFPTIAEDSVEGQSQNSFAINTSPFVPPLPTAEEGKENKLEHVHSSYMSAQNIIIINFHTAVLLKHLILSTSYGIATISCTPFAEHAYWAAW